MKFYRKKSCGSNLISRPWQILLIAGCFFMVSCEEELEPVMDGEITFTADFSNSASPETRTSRSGLPAMTKSTDDKGETFYLETGMADSIAFDRSTFPEDMPDTRSIPMEKMYDQFSVSAYTFEMKWDGSDAPNYINDIPASKTERTYTLTPTYDWPGKEFLIKFFSYAPIIPDGPYTFSHDRKMGSPIIKTIIPDQVSQQKDLITAKTRSLNGNSNEIVPLVFKHALTAVRFVCDNDMQISSIQSISLKNVCSEGTFDMNTEAWNAISSPKTFTLNKMKAVSGTDLTSPEETFMMIPQTLPENAGIEIIYLDNNGTKHTLKAKIGGKSWPKGWTITYRIFKKDIGWEYVLDATDPVEFTYKGGTKPCTVKSYRRSRTLPSRIEAVPWEITEYSTDGGQTWEKEVPAWTQFDKTAGPGDKTENGTTQTITVQKQAGVVSGADFHAAILRGRTPKGTEQSPWNLANKTGSSNNENTANCYIVDAPGSYSIPLVYGNAIKNGADNRESYTYIGLIPTGIIQLPNNISGPISDHILSPLINHEGKDITSPYIYDNVSTKDGFYAELIWQDAMNLVTDIKWNQGTDGGYISFKVDKPTIRQGNAVIAIKDKNGKVMWSWHIWVTDEDFYETASITSLQKNTYRISLFQIGWCDASSTIYKERTCLVKIKAGEKTKTVTINQFRHELTSIGNHPFFMWGRKDPILPMDDSPQMAKTWYDKDGNAHTDLPQNINITDKKASCIQQYILYPEQMHETEDITVCNSGLGDDWYFNLWNSGNVETIPNGLPVIKTIYDPSPVGYTLPDSQIFNAFTIDGKGVNVGQKPFNGIYHPEKKYFEFYTNSDRDAKLKFFETGYRFYNGAKGEIGTTGFLWTATPSYSFYEDANHKTPDRWEFGYGRSLCYNYNWVSPEQLFNRGWGYGIRPVLETNYGQ